MEYDKLKKWLKRIAKRPYNFFFKKLLIHESVKFERSINFNCKGRYIVGTKNGLFLLENECFYKLLSGEYYGITRKGETFYAFQKLLGTGQIIKFTINKKNIKPEEFITNLSRGCHQIDFIDNYLFVTDTYNNRILKFNLSGEKLCEYYPIGKLENGRKSGNYGHINSIYKKDDNLYLLCHNETKKTGRKSSILKLDQHFDVEEKIKIDAANAHNIIIYNSDFCYCDSLNKTLKLGNNVVYKAEYFTRGLSISDNLVLLGGSEFALRENRKNASGVLFFLNTDFQLLFKFKIPGMVQEIRRVDTQDYSFSNFEG